MSINTTEHCVIRVSKSIHRKILIFSFKLTCAETLLNFPASSIHNLMQFCFCYHCLFKQRNVRLISLVRDSWGLRWEYPISIGWLADWITGSAGGGIKPATCCCWCASWGGYLASKNHQISDKNIQTVCLEPCTSDVIKSKQIKHNLYWYILMYSTIQKFGVSFFSFLKKLVLLIKLGCYK